MKTYWQAIAKHEIPGVKIEVLTNRINVRAGKNRFWVYEKDPWQEHYALLMQIVWKLEEAGAGVFVRSFDCDELNWSFHPDEHQSAERDASDFDNEAEALAALIRQVLEVLNG